MNPPYLKDLFLKIISEAIDHTDMDNGGEVVNLSPISWLMDPAASLKRGYYTKYSPKLGPYIKYLESYDTKEGNDAFGINFLGNLGVYLFKKEGETVDYANYWKKFYDPTASSILEKVTQCNLNTLRDVLEEKRKDGIRLIINEFPKGKNVDYYSPVFDDMSVYIDGKNEDGSYWYEGRSLGAYKPEEGAPMTFSIPFKSVEEARNAYDSMKTSFYIYLHQNVGVGRHVPLYWLPFMGRCKHPVTGLLGYRSAWSNEDFYKYFNLTQEEIDSIESFMGGDSK